MPRDLYTEQVCLVALARHNPLASAWSSSKCINSDCKIHHVQSLLANACACAVICPSNADAHVTVALQDCEVCLHSLVQLLGHCVQQSPIATFLVLGDSGKDAILQLHQHTTSVRVTRYVWQVCLQPALPSFGKLICFCAAAVVVVLVLVCKQHASNS
jgi:hypothetical protein